mmetsp:Transcript_38079/g.62247  ORF Transcript_38079/g.62247 Transcript_38079/m.62247 type:complete len:254 (-) Transcript_38079:882-1643(-)
MFEAMGPSFPSILVYALVVQHHLRHFMQRSCNVNHRSGPHDIEHARNLRLLHCCLLFRLLFLCFGLGQFLRSFLLQCHHFHTCHEPVTFGFGRICRFFHFGIVSLGPLGNRRHSNTRISRPQKLMRRKRVNSPYQNNQFRPITRLAQIRRRRFPNGLRPIVILLRPNLQPLCELDCQSRDPPLLQHPGHLGGYFGRIRDQGARRHGQPSHVVAELIASEQECEEHGWIGLICTTGFRFVRRQSLFALDIVFVA